MPRFYQSTHSITVKAPAEKAYEALTDWSLRAKWRPGLTMSWEGDAKAFVGQLVTFKAGDGPFHYFFSYRVTGMEPPRRMFMEYTGVPLKGRAALEVEPMEGGGCQVSFHWMKVEPGDWRAKLFFAIGLGERSHAERTMETLRMLKDHLEGNGK